MAVQAQHQQLFWREISSLPQFCSNNGNGGEGSLHDLNPCIQQQQKQSLMLMAVGSSPLSLQQQLPPVSQQFLPASHEPSAPLTLLTEKHKFELDHCIHQQGQKLKVALQHQRKRHLVTLLRTAESKAWMLLNQKEREIAEVRKRSMELEECIRRADAENQTWQRIAMEQEALVLDLSNSLELVRQSYSSCDGSASSCESATLPFGVAVDRGSIEEETGRRRCRACGFRDSCVLFLPCRHLCSCKHCDLLLTSCPVCDSRKNNSIEIFL